MQLAKKKTKIQKYKAVRGFKHLHFQKINKIFLIFLHFKIGEQ